MSILQKIIRLTGIIHQEYEVFLNFDNRKITNINNKARPIGPSHRHGPGGRTLFFSFYF